MQAPLLTDGVWCDAASLHFCQSCVWRQSLVCIRVRAQQASANFFAFVQDSLTSVTSVYSIGLVLLNAGLPDLPRHLAHWRHRLLWSAVFHYVISRCRMRDICSFCCQRIAGEIRSDVKNWSETMTAFVVSWGVIIFRVCINSNVIGRNNGKTPSSDEQNLNSQHPFSPFSLSSFRSESEIVLGIRSNLASSYVLVWDNPLSQIRRSGF